MTYCTMECDVLMQDKSNTILTVCFYYSFSLHSSFGLTPATTITPSFFYIQVGYICAKSTLVIFSQIVSILYTRSRTKVEHFYYFF